MDIDLSGFRDTFFQEAAEHLETLEGALLSLPETDADTETLHAIFRCAHSIKAGAGTFGFENIARFTHVLESVLDRMRNCEVRPSPDVVKLLLRSVDLSRVMLDGAARGETGAPPELRTLTGELENMLKAPCAEAPQGTPQVEAPQGARYRIRFEPGPDLFRSGLDPLLVLRDLAQLGEVQDVSADLSRLPALGALDPETCYLGWSLTLETGEDLDQIRDVFAFVEDLAEVSIEPLEGTEPEAGADQHAEGAPARAAVAPSNASAREGSIRVATEKVDRLVDLVGELVIAQSMASEAMAGFTLDRLSQLQQALADIGRHTRELQDRVMRIRMLPIGSIFSRFPRLVHDTAQALGKQVALEISGEETELDKGVVERLSDPLTHLIRNAIDHGIESPEQRERAGKPPLGTVRLSAYHQGGSVIVQVADDGKGLDPDRIRAKALERGLIGEKDELSTQEIEHLIFRAGFSTAETVSDLSGRGVGMDVVKRNVEALNGNVMLETERGRYSRFRIKLPLTLAILDGLLIRVGSQVFVMPLVSISESIRPTPDQVQHVAGRGEVVVVRRNPLSLVRLHRLFEIEPDTTDPCRGLVVIVEHEGRQMALMVDELLGQQQVVVKSLEDNYRKVAGYMGATILGDGRASLILDVGGVIDRWRSASAVAA